MIKFAGNDIYGTEDGVGAMIISRAAATWSAATNDYPTQLEMWTTPDGAGALAARMTIDSDGNVGIGTTDPNELFEIQGTTPFISISDPDTTIDTDQAMGGIAWRTADSGSAGVNAKIYSLAYGDGGGCQLYFEAGLSGALNANQLVLAYGGNVGIGVKEPDAALEVVSDQGTGQFVAKFHHDGNTYNRHGIEVWAGAYDGGTGSGETIYFYALDGDGGEIGRLQHETGGNFAVHVTSDARLKKDIVDTKIEGLNILNALKVREFAWKKNGIKNKAAFIAQELKEVYPDAVSGDEDQKVERKTSPRLGEFEPMGVSYASLIPPLVKAIQELSAKVTALENA
jgi:hypothetical protein